MSKKVSLSMHFSHKRPEPQWQFPTRQVISIPDPDPTGQLITDVDPDPDK